MEPCSIDSWDMSIFFDDAAQTIISRPFFRDVRVNGGVITGRVVDENDTPISDLGGFCVPIPDINIPEVSQMTFLFRLRDAASEIGIFLIGHAFTRTGAPVAEFKGKWIAHPPGPNTPLAAELVTFVLPRSGDTGTGTGTQT